jgi:hypothetical protein
VRSLELKGAARLRGGDFFIRPSYSALVTNDWRFNGGGVIFGGSIDGHFGQFHRNANLNPSLRYTF